MVLLIKAVLLELVEQVEELQVLQQEVMLKQAQIILEEAEVEQKGLQLAQEVQVV